MGCSASSEAQYNNHDSHENNYADEIKPFDRTARSDVDHDADHFVVLEPAQGGGRFQVKEVNHALLNTSGDDLLRKEIEYLQQQYYAQNRRTSAKNMTNEQKNPVHENNAASVTAAEVPKTFKAKYTLGKQLGKGGYSVVYEVTDKATNKKYAVKEVTRASLKPGDEELLRQEIDIMKSLNHPHIVKFLDFFEETGKFHVVLELLEGGELFDRIVKKTSYTEKEARDLINILFRALKYIHDHKIAHRDLKPENLLLANKTDDSDVKIADFGFAKRTQGLSLTTSCGSPGYIAPEILERKPYGLPADIWSLGVITYIILGGYPPFYDDRSQAALFRKIKKGKFQFHAKYWDHISKEAKELIQGMLTVDVEKRLTIDDAINHPWLKRADADLAASNLSSNLETFKTFHASRKFRGAIKAVIAMNRMRVSSVESPRSARSEEEEDDRDWFSRESATS